MSTATQQANQMPPVPRQAPEVNPEQLAEALGITRDGLAEAAYPTEAMSTATQQTNQMPTRPAPQLRQAPGMSLDQLLQAAQFAVGNPDVAVQAARELPGGVGGVAELLPASDLERALELGGPLLGMAGPVMRAGKKAAQAARSVAQRLHPLEKKMLDEFGDPIEDGVPAFILSDGRGAGQGSGDHSRMAATTMMDADRMPGKTALEEYLGQSGSIRVTGAEGNSITFETETLPSARQVRAMAQYAKDKTSISVASPFADFQEFRTIGEMQRFFEGQ